MIRDVNTWVACAFGIDPDTSATILITLFVFVSGLIITAVASYIAGLINRNTRREIMRLNLIDFAKQLDTQAHSYRRFSRQLNVKNYKTVTFSRSDISQTSNLKVVGYENMYNAFFHLPTWPNRSKKLKAFSQIWQIIEVVTYWQQKATEDYEQFLPLYNEYNQRRNEAVSEYFDFIRPILISANKKVIDAGYAEYLSAVDAIHVAFENGGKTTLPHVIQEKLVKPLRELNRKYKNEISARMIGLILSLDVAYQNQRNLLRVKQRQFFFYFLLFNAKRRQLNLIARILFFRYPAQRRQRESFQL
jgi:hypothetical protein